MDAGQGSTLSQCPFDLNLSKPGVPVSEVSIVTPVLKGCENK